MLSWGSILRVLARSRVDAILPFSDRTNLLFLQPAKAHRSRPPLPQFRSVSKASETTAVAQSWCSFPRCSDRSHQGKATKSRQMGHDRQIGLRRESHAYD